MKRIVMLLCLLLLFPFSLFAALTANHYYNKAKIEIATLTGPTLKQGKPKELIVMAYYRPERRQRAFATGSYKKEIRLNGKGIKTASGKPPRIGTVAADPRILPSGTVLTVPGYGKAIVEDTGGYIKGNRIDLFVGSGDKGRKRAIAWGRRQITVNIIKLGNLEV